MIDNDNAALEKILSSIDWFNFFDRSKVETELTTTIYTIWTNSEAFKATHDLFIRTGWIRQSVPINSRLLLLKLAPGISDCVWNSSPWVSKNKRIETGAKEYANNRCDRPWVDSLDP
jgi:hypothetical protein